MGGNDSLSLDSEVELQVEVEQFDVATYVAARAFNSAALPPNMPEWLRATIEAKADELRSDPDNAMIFGTPATREMKQKRAEEANDEFVSQFVQIAQQRAEWSRNVHSFAGATMTGEEWGELSADLKRDGPLRDWLIQRLMREGQTKTQAERKTSEFADVAEIMAKPESERTPAERERMDRADKDPLFKKVMPELQAQERGLTAGQGVRESLSTDQKTSIGARSALFASAPDLSAEHRVALAAVEPLTPVKRDTPAPAIPTAPAPAAAGLEI